MLHPHNIIHKFDIYAILLISKLDHNKLDGIVFSPLVSQFFYAR